MKRTFILVMAIISMASHALCKEGEYLRVYVAGEGGAEFNLGPTGIWGYGPSTNKSKPSLNYFVVGRVEFGWPANGLVKRFDMITGANGKAFLEWQTGKGTNE